MYFWFGEGELWVSDSLRSLIELLPRRLTIDYEALDSYLAVEFFPAPMTPFREIRKVGVEQMCTVNLATSVVSENAYPLAARSPADFETSVERVYQACVNALNACANQCKTELVLFCSGGLDSSIIAHMMRGRGHALVLSYVNAWKDETQRARDTARNADLDLQETRLPAFTVEELISYASGLDEPVGGTGTFVFKHLCSVVPPGRWLVGGHGSGVLSLENGKFKQLYAACDYGRDVSVERFSKSVSFLDPDFRANLLGLQEPCIRPDPVELMLQRELNTHGDRFTALKAVVRRQFYGEEELVQLWPIFDAYDDIPVMLFFDPEVRHIMDRLPESILRDESFERRLLKRVAALHCPGYVKQPKQIGCGIPLGQPGYPGESDMRRVLEQFGGKGPLSENGLDRLLQACNGAEGGVLFDALRRLWAVAVLQIWFSDVPDKGSARSLERRERAR